jgi:protein-S-isoprenylcysteine O-methyltransferase Ste14
MQERIVSRISVFVYGVVCYFLAVAVLGYTCGFVGGFLTPTTLDGPARHALPFALGVDVALLAVFAVQHSGMARPAFKRWWTRTVPQAAERSTYLLASSIALGALMAFWEPIGGVVWQATDAAARALIIGLYACGWVLLLYTTFLIDHFDLFGLKQVWRFLRGQRYQPPRFHTPSLYKAVRHPLYIGWLTIVWAAPTMTFAHLVFALGSTAYILIAIQLEERDLVDAFGATYRDYRARTPMLLPRVPALARQEKAAKDEG